MSNNDFAQLLESAEGLTEQFKSSASQLFESAVAARAQAIADEKIEQAVTEALKVKLDEALEDQKVKLAAELAEKSTEFVEQEVADREKALRESITAEFTNKFNELVEKNEMLGEELKNATELHENALAEATAKFDADRAVFNETISALQESVESRAAEIAMENVSALRDRLAGYADYIAEKYADEHKDAVVTESKSIVADGILESIRGVLAQYGLGAAEGRDAFDAQIAKLTEERDQAYSNLAEAIEAKFELERKLEENVKNDAFNEITEDLTDLDRERVHALVENDTSDVETFKKRVKMLAESFVAETRKEHTPAVSTVNVVTEAPVVEKVEQTEKVLEETVDPDVAFFVNALNAGKADHY